MKQRVFIHDVVARDGFQIEPNWIPTERKIEIIDRLSQTGVAKIEATSFVSPKAVPQLRDAAEVMAGIRRNPDNFDPVRSRLERPRNGLMSTLLLV